MTLRPKQQKFVEEYLVDLNATQAAIRAGYSKKTAALAGHENLRKPKIAEAVEAAQRERSHKTGITADRVIKELAGFAFCNVVDAASLGIHRAEDLAKLPEDMQLCVAGWSYDKDGALIIKWQDKQAALDKLAKHLGIYAADNRQLADASLVERIRRARSE